AGEDGIETLKHLAVETERHRAFCPFELPDSARTDDGPGYAVLVQQPGQGDAGRLLADLIAQALVRLDFLAVALDRLPRPACQAAAPFSLLLEHSAEHAALQRRPGNHADSVVDRGRQNLELDLAGHQVVDGLLADQAKEI